MSDKSSGEFAIHRDSKGLYWFVSDADLSAMRLSTDPVVRHIAELFYESAMILRVDQVVPEIGTAEYLKRYYKAKGEINND